MWAIGLNDKELTKILSYTHPKCINIYQLLAKDLSPLEQLSNTETIILKWSTKATSLWDFSKNTSLKDLHIEDFSKLQSISEISQAKHLRNLILAGGVWKPLKIFSLSPLSELVHLEYLKLANIKVDDDSLRPLANLKNLNVLEITNQFETSEYA
ncbi:MAG TPA: hypothetical protein VD993_03715 [Chitinophagaceae bacterium]|nr:hypothetical protein [Chitinophagaceae bacterium]